MCVAIPTPFRELATLASKIKSLLKDSMIHFAELASAQKFPAMQPQTSRAQLIRCTELAWSPCALRVRRFSK